MVLNRTALRIAAPPVVAAGLVLAMMRPGVAEPVQVSFSSTLSPRSTAVAAAQSPQSAAPRAGQTVAVSVPTVAWPIAPAAQDGHVHLPVVLTDPSLTGRARLTGAPGCSVALIPGTVVWLDCDVSPRHDGARLVAKLTGGRTVLGPRVSVG